MKIAGFKKSLSNNRLSTSKASQKLEMIGHDGHLIQAERVYIYPEEEIERLESGKHLSKRMLYQNSKKESDKLL